MKIFLNKVPTASEIADKVEENLKDDNVNDVQVDREEIMLHSWDNVIKEVLLDVYTFDGMPFTMLASVEYADSNPGGCLYVMNVDYC